MPNPLSTIEVAARLRCTESVLHDLVRREIIVAPPLVGGVRLWGPIHVRAAKRLLDARAAYRRTRIGGCPTIEA